MRIYIMAPSRKTTYERGLEESKKPWKYLLREVETAGCSSNVDRPSPQTHS